MIAEIGTTMVVLSWHKSLSMRLFGLVLIVQISDAISSLYRNQGVASDVKEDLGSQYTSDLLNRFQLSRDDMFRIFDYCHEGNHSAVLLGTNQ